MKLDPTVMRTMERSDFRVLEAVERGMQHHAIVPLALIHSLAGLRHGGSHKILSSLLRDKLVSHERKHNVDGYRVTNAGYDILALHHLKLQKVIAALGQRIGTGKESDVYLAATPTGRQIVLKFHRLGRTSFRNVRQKRDYFNTQKQNQQAHSWLFLSKLSAVKEYAFMKALYDVQYPTPVPLGQNRHVIAMSLVRGLPLYQIYPKQLSVEVAADIYHQAVTLASRLASKHGLVHCDLNEFNLLVDLSGRQALATNDEHDPYVRHSGTSVAPEQSIGALSKPAWEQSLEDNPHLTTPTEHLVAAEDAEVVVVARLSNGDVKPVVTLIDFPQMISTQHVNAEEYYDRDVACLQRFFTQKLQCHIPDDDPVTLQARWDVVVGGSLGHSSRNGPDETKQRLDRDLRASGFSATDQSTLELYYFETGPRPISSAVTEEPEDEDSVDDEEDEEDFVDDDDESGQGLVEQQQCGISNDEVPESKSLNGLEELGGDDDEEESKKDDINDRVESLSLLDRTQASMSREKLCEVAKERVRKQLDEQRRRSRQKGAFRKRNTNKNYVKGKRVLTETVF